jgi:ornithine carbamoyltransferase
MTSGARAAHQAHPRFPPVDHLLRVGDLDEHQLARLLDLAAKLRDDPDLFAGRLQGESIACYFERPSTRARVAFQAAAHRLGMLPIMLRPEDLQQDRGELVEDTARVLSLYSRAIVARVVGQETLERFADAATVPVVNALSDDHDPCQALADLLTIRDVFGDLRGVRLACIGDANNVTHSLMEAGALAGMHVIVAAPPRYQPLPGVTRAAVEVARDKGGSVVVTDDPFEAADEADVVTTDVWVSMGDESEARRRRRDLAPYVVTANLMRHASPNAVFMHCLPAHRGEEVMADVIDGPRSIVFRQAANRLPTEHALLWALCTGNWPRPAGD